MLIDRPRVNFTTFNLAPDLTIFLDYSRVPTTITQQSQCTCSQCRVINLVHLYHSSNRPLPDERPRQSVANLIGRFETQSKRLSISASSPSRSSSVVSHITGDSVKEEIKEKREWPPKSVASAEKPPIVIPTSFRHVLSSLNSQPISYQSTSTSVSQVKEDPLSQAEAEVPLTTKALETQTAEAPSSFLENWRKDIALVPAETTSEPGPEVITLPLPTLTAASFQTFENPTPPPAAQTPSTSSLVASKASPTAFKAPIKGITKSPAPKQSLSSSITQPLRAQHTGQSVASTTSTRKPTLKPAPITPSQSKTGSRSDASRAKTPTSARPKTPSTGLFAPTAASLARSRNAPPPLPTPTKKTTLSSSSMDRLSKPTAASLSKARAPVIASSTSTSRLTVVKTKVAPTTPKFKQPNAQQPAAQTVAAPDQNGFGAIPIGMEGIVIKAEAPPVIDTTEGAVLVDEGALSEDADPTLVSSSPAALKEESVVEDTDKDSTSGISASEPGTHDELEHIVNLLESVPVGKSEPALIPEIPDDILDIPDEERNVSESRAKEMTKKN